MRRWIQTHITGTPEANARYDEAGDALLSYIGRAEDDEWTRLTDAVIEAEKDVPWLRRHGWS